MLRCQFLCTQIYCAVLSHRNVYRICIVHYTYQNGPELSLVQVAVGPLELAVAVFPIGTEVALVLISAFAGPGALPLP